MRIDGPKGLGAWLMGFFSGSFRGNLEGTASYAETASYVQVVEPGEWSESFLDKKQGGTIEGPLILSSSDSAANASRLVVHGNVIISGSLAEGRETSAEGNFSHAEGCQTKALGISAHAEGYKTRALGVSSHAEGRETRALGIGAHAGGLGTRAEDDYQTVFGRYNSSDPRNKHLFIIGNGKSETERSNAFAVGEDGMVEFNAGSISGSAEAPVVVSGSSVKATEVIVREAQDSKIIDRVSLEYNRTDTSLDFRFIG